MRKEMLIVVLSICFHTANAQTIFKERNFLTKTCTIEELKTIIPEYGTWKPYPTISDREVWDALDPILKKNVISKAESYIGTVWQSNKATNYLEYVRTGKRIGGGGNKMTMLTTLVFAELYENKGRFIDDIINGIWAICEETTWALSAHLHMQKAGSGLPDIQDAVVDLGAGITIGKLSWIYYLVGEKLDSVSPLIYNRLYYEANRRVFQPAFERDDIWWMGNGPHLINNWNPWICSNWLVGILFLEKNQEKRTQGIYKMMQIVDKFINSYPDDGGCDEGPSYWRHAGGTFFDFIDILASATNNQINIFDKPLIKEMGAYIYRSHIDSTYFVNFADAGASYNYGSVSTLIFQYGKMVKDTSMMQFAAYFTQFPIDEKKLHYESLTRKLRRMFIVNEINQFEKKAPYLRDVYLEGRQFMTTRKEKGSSDGLFIAAKGGNNNESHNHNDVGNFILYKNGKPVIIDVGVGEYTAKTFSDKRYEIWTMQSAYHNLPTINGVMQHEGAEFKPENVTYSKTDSEVNFSLDIAKAYPDSAMVESWIRNIRFIRTGTVELTDKYKLLKNENGIELNFMCNEKPDLSTPGVIKLTKNKDVFMYYFKMNAKVEEINIVDEELKEMWGNALYRIILKPKSNSKNGKSFIKFVDQDK